MLSKFANPYGIFFILNSKKSSNYFMFLKKNCKIGIIYFYNQVLTLEIILSPILSNGNTSLTAPISNATFGIP